MTHEEAINDLNAIKEFFEQESGAYPVSLEYAIKVLKKESSADRPQGYWTKTDVATYRCSECGKIQIADDVNELNFCCCCGSRNKVRRVKGADDDIVRVW